VLQTAVDCFFEAKDCEFLDIRTLLNDSVQSLLLYFSELLVNIDECVVKYRLLFFVLIIIFHLFY
jgi:hypothetical protein